MKFTEKHPRSLVKTISWRVLMTISLFVNGYIVTGSVASGLHIAGWAAIFNTILYFTHERTWNWLQWNRKKDNGLLFKDGHPRTTSKMISWRLLVNISNFSIAYIETGSWVSAGVFLGLVTVINMIIFYLHERTWNIVIWGKIKKA
jgi:uncharacterized membrane protein